MKLGIKDTERHLLLKYHDCLQKYLQDKMEFLDISLLDMWGSFLGSSTRTTFSNFKYNKWVIIYVQLKHLNDDNLPFKIYFL